MILIDEYADTLLLKALEGLRTDTDATRCIHFKFAGLPELKKIPALRDKLIAAARKHIASPNTKIYLCEDGDIFILAPHLATKDAKAMILETTGALGIAAHQGIAALHEASITLNQLLIAVEHKLEAKRNALAEAQKIYAETMAARKRERILSGGGGGQQSPAERRKARSEPELMMIEDDVFSSRLVENVLQKQFRITTLASADNALATYTRLAPDLLFLDINLPDVTGHELLEKIIALDPDAYVIMLSGNADKDNIMQAMSRGAKGFIAKPFTREKLFQYIDRCPTIKH